MSTFKRIWNSQATLLTVILLGIAARFVVSARGHNFDFDSFTIVAEITDAGGNVYAGTTRYNYGPAWSILIHLMYQAASRDLFTFRMILIAFLTVVDMAIFAVLCLRISRTAAFLFFLSPITIIITGFHNQFDNLTVLTGMAAVVAYGDNYEGGLDRRKLLGLLFLGLSLVIKHVLFAFPLWLAVKQRGLWQKAVVLILPVALFAASFVPYWKEGAAGIVQNVLLYRSFENAPLLGLLAPGISRWAHLPMLMWLALLVGLAFTFRARTGLDTLLLYTCVLVFAAPALANQYLAITVPFVAVNQNVFTWAFTLVGTHYLSVHSDGLGIDRLRDFVGIYLQRHEWMGILALLLGLGFCLSLWPGASGAARRAIPRLFRNHANAPD